MEVSINYLAVLLAAASSMVVGAIWYAKPVFGTAWIKMVGLSEEQMKKGSVMALVGAFVLSLIAAYVLAYFASLANYFFGNSFLQDALVTAFLLWLGFGANRLLTHELFEQKRKKLMALNKANEFVTIMLMGLIIGLMGV